MSLSLDDAQCVAAFAQSVKRNVNLLFGVGSHQRETDERILRRDSRTDHRINKIPPQMPSW